MLAVGSAFDSLPLIHYAALNLLSSLKRGGAIDVKDDNANFSRRRSIGLIQSNLPLFLSPFLLSFPLAPTIIFYARTQTGCHSNRFKSRYWLNGRAREGRWKRRRQNEFRGSLATTWREWNSRKRKRRYFSRRETKIRLLLAFGFLLALVSFVAIGNCSTNRLISGKSLGNCQFNKNKC